MEKKPQNLQNHGKVDPAFHYFLFAGIVLLLAYAIYNAVQTGLSGRTGLTSAALLLAVIWALVLMFKVRLYSLKVQDRVIRLEERLRMERLLPAALKSRIYELTEQQLIALRFASDGELPALVEKTLAGNLPPKAIKQAIQSWRPDYWRV
jgi:Family of unknown function (DUF6526)